MRNKSGIRALALVLAMVMVLGLVPAAAAAPAQSETKGFKTIAEYLDEQKQTFDRVDPNTEVEFIVELEEAPLADSLTAGMKLADFLNTQKGTVQANAIEQQQAVMAAAIESCTDDVAITHRYQVVMNGFAVTGKLSDREALEALEGVKRVTLGNTYDVPELMEAEGELITSGELMNSDAANAEGFTGKGIFAAVLDTGLKVDHEAFIGEKVAGAVITADTIAALTGLTASGDLYKNAKVAFAYDYADEDDDVSDPQGHGTHVAGTVAANGETFRGVAPDAQLAIMKVFPEEGGANDSDIIAALEDCVILGVDTVNMSLGTPCGFVFEDEATNAVYNKVRNAGVNLMISAGNDYNAANQNLHGTDLALAGNPDYGIVGSPSTYAAALSVASVNENLAYSSYLLLGEEKITFDETPDAALKIGDLEGTFEYVRVSGVGNVNDFAKVDVTGKIALVERGEIAFTEKEQNAYDAGAVAMIVYNNTDAEETVYMQLNGLLPSVFLSKAEGKLLKDAAVKEVTVSAKYSGRMENPEAGKMSDFSSMGVAPDLSLKPEITAPGGNVWSTSNSGSYEEMSGTSMAAPHMTGAAALVRQYVNETYTELSDLEKQELVDNLLMSTAVPVTDPNGVSYTPRKQGAGLANVSAAIHAESYLTVDGGRPKAELGESEEGSYSFTVTVHNISSTAKTWNVSLNPIAAQTEEHDGNLYISELCRAMEAEELKVTFSAETVTVQPGETADVTVSIELTEAGKEALSVFPNGIYVEGFVRLTGDDAASLGLPYLGFYGDWADAPIFDSTMYDDEPSFMAESAIAQMDYNGNGNYLGVNAITNNARAEWISYGSRNAGYYLITPMQGLLRAPKEIWYTAVSDADPENPVYVMAYENSYKSFYYSSGGYIYTDFVPWDDSWQPIGGNDDEGYWYLEDGPYTYRIEARIDGQDEYQKSEYPIFIDNEAPSVVDHTYEVVDGKPTLTIRVTDNHYVMAAQLVNEDFDTALSPIMAVEETELGAVTTLTFDLTEVQADGYKMCRLDLYDYAWNETLSDLMSTTSQDIEPQIVQINQYAVTANVDTGNMEMDAIVDPAEAVNKTLSWSSTDESVAKVVSVSEDTLSAVIDFVGPGSCEIRATAVNGVYGAASVTVSKPASSDWPSDNVIREDGYYTIPKDLNTNVTITDNAHDVWLTGAEGNTMEYPYNNLVIASRNEELDLTIENLHLKNSVNYSYNSGIIFTGTGNTLTLVGDNSVAQADYSTHASISVAYGVDLTINGSGTLIMKGNCNAYGSSIGGDVSQRPGKIVIDNGHFIFNSVNQGAGIGGGANASGGDIIINGGTFEMNVPRRQMGYMYNTTYTGACIGSGNAASKDTTTKITINDGTFTGTTGTGSALIGTGHGSACNLILDINGGTFDLVTEDTDPDAMTGGACIGTGQVGYSGTPTADITINGGEIKATSRSSGAAIGGGPGINTGSVYIFGGTITAVAEADGDAIGAGAYPSGTTNNIRIHGGTVKATTTGEGAAFGDDTLVNDDSDAVFLVNIEAPNVTSVIIDGKDWGISANHPEDDQLYLYLTASETAHEVVINGETYLVTVTSNGDVTVTAPVTVDKNALNAAIASAEALNGEDYTPATWAAVEEALDNAKAAAANENATQAEIDAALAALNAAVAALVTKADKTALNAAIASAEALNGEDYTSATWAAVEEALDNAKAASANENATQEEVNTALAALNAAVAALIRRGDKTALTALYDNAALDFSRLAEVVFSADLIAAMEDALAAAEAVLANADATEADVEAAYTALRNAWDALKGARVNNMYNDVPAGGWYDDAVDFVTRYGFMNGMNNGKFSPGGEVKRAQFVTILYRIAGEPEVTIDNPFEDVPAGEWYTNAVLWAFEKGITTGADATHFNPGGVLIRQNMVTFLMRFAKAVDLDTTKRADLSGYTDAGEIAAHAQDAMQWAVAEGIISGMSETTLAPNGVAKRAQIATIISRFVPKYLW